jgi:general secretion pathway protein L
VNTLAPALRPWLERARQAWARSRLPHALAWWQGELVACLPMRWRAWLQRGPQWLLLDASTPELMLRRLGETTPLARIDADQAPELQGAALREGCSGVDPADFRLVLCVSPAVTLRRRLTLPAAASADLRQALAYDMDRQTPFRLADVYYDAREQTLAKARLQVELVVVPRAHVDPVLARLKAAGIDVDGVDMADGAGRLGVNLLPREQCARRAHPRRRLNGMLACVALALLVLAMQQWVSNRRAALVAMRTQVAALRVQAQQVAELRQRLLDRVGASRFLARRRAQSPTVLDILDDVTHRLPDGTWLERLSVNGGQVGLQGQSPQATALLERMKGSAVLSEPSFQGVIQADPQTGKERFYMVAQRHASAAATKETAHARTVAR